MAGVLNTMTIIDQAIAQISTKRGVRILFAIESGSRAWGFASQDSDYDVRFVFVWPQDHYLRVQLPADHIHEDLPGDLDMSGWDLRKALHHFGKSNASFYEWVNSPIVYQDSGLIECLRDLSSEYFQTKPAVDHYLGLAKQLWLRHVNDTYINGKWFLYILRATLAAQWILKSQAPPPVLFVNLLPLIHNAALHEEIHHLLQWKQAGSEADNFLVSVALRDFLVQTRTECEDQSATLTAGIWDEAPLDLLFQQVLAVA